MANPLGMECKLYRNTGSSESPTWTLIGNVRDVSFEMTSSEADVTTRGNAGWRAMRRGLKEASITFEMVWDTTDTNFSAIQSAYFAGTSIEFAVMDGLITTNGSSGLRATMSVMSFSRQEPLEGAVTASVTLKPTYAQTPPAWMVVEGD